MTFVENNQPARVYFYCLFLNRSSGRLRANFFCKVTIINQQIIDRLQMFNLLFCDLIITIRLDILVIYENIFMAELLPCHMHVYTIFHYFVIKI